VQRGRDWNEIGWDGSTYVDPRSDLKQRRRARPKAPRQKAGLGSSMQWRQCWGMRKKHATAASSLFVELRAGAEPECDGRRYRDAGGKARCAKGKHDGSCFEYSAAETQGFSCSVYARAVDELEACEACEAAGRRREGLDGQRRGEGRVQRELRTSQGSAVGPSVVSQRAHTQNRRHSEQHRGAMVTRGRGRERERERERGRRADVEMEFAASWQASGNRRAGTSTRRVQRVCRARHWSLVQARATVSPLYPPPEAKLLEGWKGGRYRGATADDSCCPTTCCNRLPFPTIPVIPIILVSKCPLSLIIQTFRTSDFRSAVLSPPHTCNRHGMDTEQHLNMLATNLAGRRNERDSLH
jgi:hypothetical protein